MWQGIDPLDTIVAVASAPGPAARGIVRASGPRLLECIERCFRPDNAVLLRDVRLPTVVAGAIHLEQLDRWLTADLYFWPTTRSYTRQPSAELHTLGSPPLLDAAVAAFCAAGARPAMPGEFTLRSFLAGRIDLTQAEAVLGVIGARGPEELDVALEQLAGGLAGPLGELRSSLLDLLADLEAGLDFVDEDIAFISDHETDRRLADADAQLQRLLAKMNSRHRPTDAVRVVLIGWPNVGKSSLFNALLGDQQALVSEIAGTTRDYLTARIEWDEISCELIDTAGTEPNAPTGGLAELARQKTEQQHERAGVRVLCLDCTRPLNEWERTQLALLDDRPCVVVMTKTDLEERGARSTKLQSNSLDTDWLRTSSATGAGIDRLRTSLQRHVMAATQQTCGVVPSTVARCRESVRLAALAIERGREILRTGEGQELLALELRAALDELGQVLGAVYTEDILERIFGRFCIGK